MKAPLEWLCELIGASLKADYVAERLTLSGLEVEAILESDEGPVLDVAVTPNRADCLSIRGLARECAAVLGYKGIPQPKPANRAQKGDANVIVREPELCTRYCGQLMGELQVGESPEWLRRRLEACGIRSINNVVDATNYVLLEWGQPLHAFDLDRLQGERLLVRRAKRNEVLVTLDGIERDLVRSDLVIADDKKAVALAGVMGGEDSEVKESTRRLFLESACFDPATVRRTARRLGLQTESSYRFERGVDWNQVGAALDRLTEILRRIANAKDIGRRTDVIGVRPRDRRIGLSTQGVEKILGKRMKVAEMTSPLRRIGCRLTKKAAGKWSVQIPSHRGDLQEEVDLIEEVARLEGYEKVPAVPPLRPVRESMEPMARRLQKSVKNHLISLGFEETIHFSFCSEEELSRLGDVWKHHAIRLANPLSQEAAYMRPTLLTSLLGTAQYHHHRQMANLRFFEFRSVFLERAGSVVERRKVAGVLSGASQPRHWSQEERAVDFYEAKGCVASIVERMGIDDIAWGDVSADESYIGLLHPGQSAVLNRHGQNLGVVGLLHPEVEAAYALKGAVYVFELDWPLLLEQCPEKIHFQPYSVYPSIERDLALVVDEEVAASDLVAIIAEEGRENIRDIRIFDVYRGPQVPAGQKSLAIAYQVGRMDRTLHEEEAQALQDKILDQLKKKLQVGIR